MSCIVAGIHTGIGKTLCSAVICKATGYAYWKPVQAGDLGNSDSDFIRKHTNSTIHPERYRLKIAASPHYAAEQEGITIRPEDFKIPGSKKGMVIETAGGIMSPLAPGYLNIDLVVQLNLEVVLVVSNYLGSINHSQLTSEVLKHRHVPVKGIVFCGQENKASELFILRHTGYPELFRIPQLDTVNKETISKLAESLRINSLNL